MNRLIMAVALLLSPFLFLSQAQANIFEDGTVDLKEPSQNIIDLYCSSATDASCLFMHTDEQSFIDDYIVWKGAQAGQYWATAPYSSERSVKDGFDNIPTTNGYAESYSIYAILIFSVETGNRIGSFNVTIWHWTTMGKTCPPADHPSYKSTYVPIGADSENFKCYDPNQVNLSDDCDIASGNEFLSIPVTVGAGCFTTENHSQCKYNAVDMGNGIQAYQLDLEGDCYSEQLPDIEGTPQETPTDSDDTCKDWGGTGMVCPENPEDVCTGNSTFAGGVVNNCQQGCGEMNGVFTCVDNDFDGDEIPDYLDPDLDGDGIRNEDDLDNNNDGKDDVIDNSTQSGKGPVNGTGGGVSIDLGPVVSELKEIKKSISETEVELSDSPTAELEGFWESEYEDGLEGVVTEKTEALKGTSFYGFLDQFKVSASGSSAVFDMCFNLGSMGNFGCHNFNIDPRTFPAIKIFILISAGFLCRRILFGG